MQARIYPAVSYHSLKAAFRRLTKTVGGQEAAASITRVDHQRIGRYGRAHEAMFAPIDVVADLEADAGAPLVTRILADLAGYVLIEKAAADGDVAWVACLGDLARQAGEALSRLGVAVADDGTVTADEVRQMDLRREVREAMVVLARIDAALQRVERAQ